MSCWRHAALMRTIQSRRNSPLRARRSRKAYAPERMTCSFALRKLRLLAPEYPWADSKTARRCFLAWTERLTRAMTPLLLLPRLRPSRTLPRRRAVDSSSAAGAAAAQSRREPRRTGVVLVVVGLCPPEQLLDVLAVAAGDLC